MRVGVDFRLPVNRARNGIERYAKALITAAVSRRQDVEYVLYVDRPPPEDIVAVVGGADRVRFKVLDATADYAWEHVLLPIHARRDRLDVFYRPNDVGGFWFWPRCAWIVDVHDLIPALLPRTFFRGPLHRAYYRWKMELTRRADAVITHSEWSRQTIHERLRLPPARVAVVTEGVDTDVFRPLPDGVARARVMRLLGRDPGPFIFLMGSVEPRKNTRRALQAYAQARRRWPDVRMVLLDANWRGAGLEESVARLGLASHVMRVAAPISDADLVGLYNTAVLFLYPSLYEGFGLPALEAMACGTPVITSSRTALPEVAGEAARLVDPDSDEQIGEAIEALLTDGVLRASYRRLGLDRARRFTWANSADQVLALFRTVARPRRRAR